MFVSKLTDAWTDLPSQVLSTKSHLNHRPKMLYIYVRMSQNFTQFSFVWQGIWFDNWHPVSLCDKVQGFFFSCANSALHIRELL